MSNLCKFYKFSLTWKGVITYYLITIIAFILYLLYVAPLKVFLAGDLYLDLREGGYSLNEAMIFFERLGQLGRAFYIRSTIFDTIWPLLVAVSSWLLARKTFNNMYLIFIAAAFPVAFGVLDLFENIGLIIMNLNYPDINNSVVNYTNFLTLTKLKTIPLMAISFIGMPIIAVIVFRRNRTRK